MIRKEQLLISEDKAPRTQVSGAANPMTLSIDTSFHSIHLVKGDVKH